MKNNSQDDKFINNLRITVAIDLINNVDPLTGDDFVPASNNASNDDTDFIPTSNSGSAKTNADFIEWNSKKRRSNIDCCHKIRTNLKNLKI